ncbi:hypothetical protein [Paenibacillus sp. FSL W7-1332]
MLVKLGGSNDPAKWEEFGLKSRALPHDNPSQSIIEICKVKVNLQVVEIL